MPTGVYKRTEKHKEIMRNAIIKKHKEDPTLRERISIATKIDIREFMKVNGE